MTGGEMAMTRDQVAQFVFAYFADHFHMPAGNFTEATDLRNDLIYDDQSLVGLGKDINKAQWNNVHVLPTEIVACNTIGDVIDLIISKNP